VRNPLVGDRCLLLFIANASMSPEPLILAGGQLESAQAIEQVRELIRSPPKPSAYFDF
jgi:hypothetical protein